MYAPEFGYLRAHSVEEAATLLAAHPGAKILAGGYSLIPMLKLRLAAPTTLVDIGRIAELKGIEVVGQTLRIGALTTHAELASSSDVRCHAPALAEAAGLIGDPARPQPRYDRWQRRARRSRLRPARGAVRAGGDLCGRGERWRSTRRRRGLLPGADDDGPGRWRSADRHRDPGRGLRAGERVREVHASRLALCGDRGGRLGDDC